MEHRMNSVPTLKAQRARESSSNYAPNEHFSCYSTEGVQMEFKGGELIRH